MKVLIVEDDAGIAYIVNNSLSFKFETTVCTTKEEAMSKFPKIKPGVVILDLGIPEVTDGFMLVEEFLKADPLLKIIVATGRTEREYAHQAIKRGVFDFFTKPVDTDKLLISVEHACRIRELEEEVSQEQKRDYKIFEGMVGVSDAIKKVFSLIEKVSQFDVPVLVLGESGVGKELVSRAIHSNSPRRDKNFIAINCAAIPENLLEAELFGYERGAFTGADRAKAGKIVLASEGSILLDEIGELRIDLQAKLLRGIEEGVVWPVGATKPVDINTRFIFSTNNPLEEKVKKGKFREDLFFRISAFTIEIPPLRERREDVFALSYYFLKKTTHLFGKKIIGFSENAWEFLRNYDFPGNVRELKNMIERAAVLCEREFITKSNLLGEHNSIGIDTTAGPDFREKTKGKLKEVMSMVEKQYIEDALKKSNYNIKKAAEALGISRPSLYISMKKHKIKLKD